jgi:hypothetical protein
MQSNVDDTEKSMTAMATKYINDVVSNLDLRLSDQFKDLTQLYADLSTQSLNADSSNVCKSFHISEAEFKAEWRILIRHPVKFNSIDNLLKLAAESDLQAMFPIVSKLAKIILILPVGTANVERSFSTMNRIFSSERCRLLPQHIETLMDISIEGPEIPDVRNGTDEQRKILNEFLHEAYCFWLLQVKRRVDS